MYIYTHVHRNWELSSRETIKINTNRCSISFWVVVSWVWSHSFKMLFHQNILQKFWLGELSRDFNHSYFSQSDQNIWWNLHICEISWSSYFMHSVEIRKWFLWWHIEEYGRALDCVRLTKTLPRWHTFCSILVCSQVL